MELTNKNLRSRGRTSVTRRHTAGAVPSGGTGFTLVELLTSVGIIALLAALLLPALLASRDRSRASVCISNMRQLGNAIQMYQSDYNNARPLDVEALSPLVSDRRVFVCPEDRTGDWAGLVNAPFLPPGTPPEPIPYSYFFGFVNYGYADLFWNKDAGPLGSRAGIAACQLHGSKRPDVHLPNVIAYEGAVLRLQVDGAVVRKRIRWKANESGDVTASPDQLLFGPDL